MEKTSSESFRGNNSLLICLLRRLHGAPAEMEEENKKKIVYYFSRFIINFVGANLSQLKVKSEMEKISLKSRRAERKNVLLSSP